MRSSRKSRRDKRRRDSHWKRLGFESESTYLEWCASHGFQATTEKSFEDRQQEMAASFESGPGWNRVSERGDLFPRPTVAVTRDNVDDVRRSVLQGKVRYGRQCDRRFAGLCRGVERLRGRNFESTLPSYRGLINACVRRNAFLFEFPRPGIRGMPFKPVTFAEALALVAKHRHAWIRPLEDWKVQSGSYMEQFRSLLSHLFVRYDAPAHLFNCWFHPADTPHRDELQTFLHVAAGHSVRTMHPAWNYSRRMSHFFMEAPDGLRLSRALRWGQVLAWGGSQRLAKAIVKTFLGDSNGSNEFWDSVVKWFIDWEAELLPVDIQSICDYLNNQKFGVGNPEKVVVQRGGHRVRERMPAEKPQLSMKGRTPAAMRRDVERWHRELARHGGSTILIWEASSIDPLVWQSKSGETWTIEELLSDGALYEEGRELNHCVGSYADSCESGHSTLWSMTRAQPGTLPKRVLTLQVVMSSLTIVQARGFANREPRRDELEAIRQWASQEFLSLEL